MNSEEIRTKFRKFFIERGHKIIPSSSLLSDDSSVLLTTAGMQQFKKYFTGELNAMKDFGSSRTASIQKCFRTSDIEEVGDDTHLTFLEMLGNFSFGPVGSDDSTDFQNQGACPEPACSELVESVEGYFKKSAIYWAYEFLINTLGIDRSRLSVTVFEGDMEVPFDQESYGIWKKEIGLMENRIKKCGRTDNFWGPTGNEGPCGPTTELYIDGIEVWNLVFNEYYSDSNKTLTKLKNPGVDTGMGLERLVMVVQKKKNIFETDLFKPLINLLDEDYRKYNLLNNENKTLSEPIKRVIVDHARAIIFLIADGVLPSNKGVGYVLRRLIRLYTFHVYPFSSLSGSHSNLLKGVINLYKESYPNLDSTRILPVFDEESLQFLKTMTRGLDELYKAQNIDDSLAFKLYESYGLPFDVIKKYAGTKAENLSREAFNEKFKKHQEISRAGQEKKFGGHGLILDTGELKARDKEELDKVLRLHTTTHLLHQALRDVLGNDVRQAGSDITAERTRFDFEFNRKMTKEEIKKVEELINQKIKEDLLVGYKELPESEAEDTGALHFFKQKYPEKVKVYFVGNSLESAYSKEFCGGPHVEHTGQIGGIKITKEEAVAAGIRRIRVSLIQGN